MWHCVNVNHLNDPSVLGIFDGTAKCFHCEALGSVTYSFSALGIVTKLGDHRYLSQILQDDFVKNESKYHMPFAAKTIFEMTEFPIDNICV